jgi:hypothetical protein
VCEPRACSNCAPAIPSACSVSPQGLPFFLQRGQRFVQLGGQPFHLLVFGMALLLELSAVLDPVEQGLGWIAPGFQVEVDPCVVDDVEQHLVVEMPVRVACDRRSRKGDRQRGVPSSKVSAQIILERRYRSRPNSSAPDHHLPVTGRSLETLKSDVSVSPPATPSHVPAPRYGVRNDDQGRIEVTKGAGKPAPEFTCDVS